jgi:hypothetical protein
VAVVGTAREKIRRFRADVSGAAGEGGRAAALKTAARIAVGAGLRAGAYLLETAVDYRMGATTRGMVKNDVLLATSLGADGHWYQAVPSARGRS